MAICRLQAMQRVGVLYMVKRNPLYISRVAASTMARNICLIDGLKHLCLIKTKGKHQFSWKNS